ncbi:MAG: multiheme c-type cytochrome, partial [Thermoplasmata archaeon]
MIVSKKDIGTMAFAATLFLLFFVLVSFSSTDMRAETPGTRATGDYQGAFSCQEQPGCHSKHSEQYDSWILSSHASAWDTLNNSMEKQDWCEVCHTTGAKHPELDGFNTTNDWPDNMKNVQCEACHGP